MVSWAQLPCRFQEAPSYGRLLSPLGLTVSLTPLPRGSLSCRSSCFVGASTCWAQTPRDQFFSAFDQLWLSEMVSLCCKEKLVLMSSESYIYQEKEAYKQEEMFSNFPPVNVIWLQFSGIQPYYVEECSLCPQFPP